MEAMITLNEVSVFYDKQIVLKNISMEFQKHKITSIIGPSGCGKSTLLKAINNMILEDSNAQVTGSIFLEGKNIGTMETEELRRRVGLVFQQPTPFPFSIYKNMTYAPIFYGIKDKKKLEALVQEKLILAGLYHEVKHDLQKQATKLSGGQQQRLCIARALTVNPDVLMLDEPCSALDVQSTAKIEEMLLALSQHYTIIIVTHNLSQAKRIAHHTAFLFEGEVVEFGATEKIFSHPMHQKTKEYVAGMYG